MTDAKAGKKAGGKRAELRQMLRLNPRRLSTRLPLLTALIIILTMSAALVVMTFGLNKRLVHQVDLELARSLSHGVASAKELAPQLPNRDLGGPGGGNADGHGNGQGGNGHGGPPGLRGPGDAAGTLQLVTTDGAQVSGLVGRGFSVEPLSAEQITALQDAEADRAETVEVPGVGPYRVMRSTVNGTDIISGLPLETTNDVLISFVQRGLLTTFLAAFLAAVLARLWIGRMLRPLDEVADTAREVVALDLTHGTPQLPHATPAKAQEGTEAAELATALNTMLGHIGQALESRETSERQVRQFVADASHELRTPLASVTGYAQLLEGETDPEKREWALGRIRSESARMTELVEDLLLLARLDQGRTLAEEPVDLTLLAVEAVSDAHVSLPEHQWKLELPDPAAGEDVECAITGDESRLRQALGNLISNAGQHTPAGTTIWVGLRQSADNAVLTVRDDGPGIPAEVREHIFDRFVRADSARARKDSTGLGLSITAAVIAAHGGTVMLLPPDPYRPGTTFEVRLPLSQSAAAATPPKVG